QQLYEGVEIGDEGQVGLITYMRTDSTHVAREAQAEARDWIASRLGGEYLPDTPPAYKVKKGAQEAHEAIRPSEVARDPRTVPPLEVGEILALLGLDPKQHFTQPPPRFTEASLVKTLEERGIGRPSTYSAILSTIQTREYVRRERATLFPTELGIQVTDLLTP